MYMYIIVIIFYSPTRCLQNSTANVWTSHLYLIAESASACLPIIVISRRNGLRYPFQFCLSENASQVCHSEPVLWHWNKQEIFRQTISGSEKLVPCAQSSKAFNGPLVYICGVSFFWEINVTFFSPCPFNVSSIRSLVEGGQHWPELARQMNERDQEAFADWRPLACVIRVEFPLCLELRLSLEDPGGLYPNIRLCSCLALSETERALLGRTLLEQ